MTEEALKKALNLTAQIEATEKTYNMVTAGKNQSCIDVILKTWGQGTNYPVFNNLSETGSASLGRLKKAYINAVLRLVELDLKNLKTAVQRL